MQCPWTSKRYEKLMIKHFGHIIIKHTSTTKAVLHIQKAERSPAERAGESCGGDLILCLGPSGSPRAGATGPPPSKEPRSRVWHSSGEPLLQESWPTLHNDSQILTAPRFTAPKENSTSMQCCVTKAFMADRPAPPAHLHTPGTWGEHPRVQGRLWCSTAPGTHPGSHSSWRWGHLCPQSPGALLWSEVTAWPWHEEKEQTSKTPSVLLSNSFKHTEPGRKQSIQTSFLFLFVLLSPPRCIGTLTGDSRSTRIHKLWCQDFLGGIF